MRHGRRSGHGGMEFGSSGEDSFVAVVVTKLTGALLFILLLTMVIMALIPRAMDVSAPREAASSTLAIATPSALPEAITGRPYTIALAATGANGPLSWSVEGDLPKGLAFDADRGIITGVPSEGTPEPVTLTLHVSDSTTSARQATHLVVFEPDKPLQVPGRWEPKLPPIPLRAWLDRGFGFLILMLVHLVGMNTLTNLEQGRIARGTEASAFRGRFRAYRVVLRLATVSTLAALAVWLWWQPGA